MYLHFNYIILHSTYMFIEAIREVAKAQKGYYEFIA
jgi:hypothetical protein